MIFYKESKPKKLSFFSGGEVGERRGLEYLIFFTKNPNLK